MKNPDRGYIVLSCFAGHGMLYEGKQVLLTNEYDSKKGFYKRINVEEGIRALIIDKDNKAKWKYDSIANVPSEWLDRHTDVAWDKNPLEDL